jgi:hypothetical protein
MFFDNKNKFFYLYFFFENYFIIFERNIEKVI